jgi:hypothetical protein
MESWVNLHWSHLRFDGWREYGIFATPDISQSNSSWRIDNFTADNKNLTDPSNVGKAFLGLQLSASSVNLGPMHFNGGRIEYNQLSQAPNAIVHILAPSGTPGGLAELMFMGVGIGASGGADPACFVYRDSVTNNGEYLRLIECKMPNGNTPPIDGAIPANWPPINLPTSIADFRTLSDGIAFWGGQQFHAGGGDWTFLSGRKHDSTYNIWELRSNGDFYLGDGFSAMNSAWGRIAHQRIGPKDGGVLRINSGTTANRPTNTGDGDLYADTTLNKLITYIGGAWRDGSGTAV